tara:strand:+ start:177 stop:710 length:534 start_codon:yes stop_codon:yes gene_type:complete
MATLDEFKAQLIGGGARPNQFRVTLTPPSGIVIGLDVRRTSFLIKGTNLPAQNIGEIPVPFRGRTLYMAGDRAEFDAWTTTIINDTDFMVRNALERWMNGINDLENNTGVIDVADYQTDATVEQLDRDDTVLKTYIFRGIWPQSLAAIDLNHETANTIEEFECTWRYQHFVASGVNF